MDVSAPGASTRRPFASGVPGFPNALFGCVTGSKQKIGQSLPSE